MKISYPQRYGFYSELETVHAVYQFNLNGEIRFARGKGSEWPDPQEWLKRTAGNDWVYYSTGGYAGVYAAIGEYYLPNLQYPTNSLIGGHPFANPCVRRIINDWYEDIVLLYADLPSVPKEIDDFFGRVLAHGPSVLGEKARRLFAINGDRVTVLPPDTRHVDYDVIPLSITSGCLYKCRFCKVKNTRAFANNSEREIERQLALLQELYGEDLKNYNSVFLGEHDSLAGGRQLLLWSIARAHDELGFASSSMRGANYFLFGSCDSLIDSEERLFEELHQVDGHIYINIGFESADQHTLDMLGKPLTVARVGKAFRRMQEINDRYANIEITGNFLMDTSLPAGHYPGLLGLVRESLPRKKPKGCIYLSPLTFDSPSRELVFDFNRLKVQSRLPMFLYIIQRL